MSWSVSGEISAANREDEINALNPNNELGEGASKQLTIAKESALNLLGVLSGSKFTVSLSGHSQADMPNSAPDSVTISIYGQSE